MALTNPRTRTARAACTRRRTWSTCTSPATSSTVSTGEVYLWGTVVEHKLGWRAQFAYPKSLFLPPDAIPFALTEIDARLKTLIAFGTNIFIAGDHQSIRFWKNGSGFDAAGL